MSADDKAPPKGARTKANARMLEALKDILRAEEVHCIGCSDETPATWTERPHWNYCDACAENARDNGLKLKPLVQTPAAVLARAALEDR